ncbi:transmembrane protease serine 13-like [Salvelinus fontinalis]|uniref:transmembrane protease serine 13-like n=1 Tax=Salvelinus fontinalis TaxID=8038 RepID=UPI0024853B4F|nr:transmembrane protease serine 13-like [Salvelinus fontinalis]
MEHDQNSDHPPPYYLAVVPTQPPPQYGDVVGTRGWSDTPSQPYYINQPMPHANVIHVSQSTPPCRKKSLTCGNSSHCYRGSGEATLLLVFLVIALWLGVCYGPSLVSGHLSSSEAYQPSEMEKDSCPSNTVECDGQQECKLGSDETNCLRFGSNGALQVKTNSVGSFLPVCYSGWNKGLADQTCAQLGFRASHSTSSVKDGSSTTLTVTGQTCNTIQGKVSVNSSSCLNKDTVSLQCINCGRQQSSRIIGGSAANLGDWPWQVSLHFRGFHTCGGTLVAPDFVVTAAHCFPRKDSSYLVPNNWRLYMGMVSQTMLPVPEMVEKIIVHESYDDNTNNYDIALLKLTHYIDYSNSIQPVCLPAYDKTVSPGTKCWTSGFGTTEQGTARGSTSLMEVTVDIIDSSVCNRNTVYNGQVSQNMLCAGDIKGSKDSCQRDSGGPLVCKDSDQRWYLMGVTSWGVGCGRRNMPGVYSHVSRLLPWVYSKMQQARP